MNLLVTMAVISVITAINTAAKASKNEYRGELR
jgi:hypothetical protein